jgi:hypothetical protein
MFGFQHGSIHVSKDDAYDDNNVVKNSIYQEHVSNPNGVDWISRHGGIRLLATT